VRGKKLFPDRNRLIFQWRGKRIVPSIEEAECCNDANDLHNLFLVPVLAQVGEHFVCYGIWHGSGRNCKIERDTFSRAEERARLVVPDRGKFPVFNAKVQCAASRMGHAVLAAGSPAGDVRDEPLEAAIDFAVRVPDGGRHLRERLCQFGLALHDENAVRNEPQILPHRLELILQLGRMLRREGGNTR
jgi:hypothetical protein